MARIVIDGKEVEAEQGSMIIEAADKAGIPVPRFCYHKKLSIAANCRMCLVEVDKMGKPVPACATPVTEGMQVKTCSKLARDAQKSVMEFLLINHPLDCPICDQGGECELQDVSLEYGNDVSRFSQGKRSVDDDNLGSLISTEMTRCIHCTRCVRFGEEIAGVRELGLTSRGEHAKISTYVEHAMTSEVSGNIIDLCPVGALTSKPSRYGARAWELQSTDSIGAHDCVGSNLHIHTFRGQTHRAVPRENEDINETWISDRDRFSYLGVRSEERALEPMLKENGEWKTCDWKTALNHVAERLQTLAKKQGADQLGAMASPSSTVEELYLLQGIMRALGSDNIDHRLHQIDFSGQDSTPLFPAFELPISALSQVNSALLIGSHIQKEQPSLGLRLRHALLQGATMMAINPIDYETYLSFSPSIVVAPSQMVEQVAAVAKAVADRSESKVSAEMQAILKGIEANASHQTMAEQLSDGESSVVMLGAVAINHPQYSLLRALAHFIADATGAKLLNLTEGANAAGAWLAGCTPHRGAAGSTTTHNGLNTQAMFAEPRAAYVLMNVEPELDIANPAQATAALHKAEFVVHLSAFVSDQMREQADVILPVAPFTETAGTFVNAAGIWQSFTGAASPTGQSRPAWKVLRVLANFLGLEGFEYESSKEVSDALQQQVHGASCPASSYKLPKTLPAASDGLARVTRWPMYRVDGVVRRSTPLQQVAGIDQPAIYIHPNTAKQCKLSDGQVATAKQDNNTVELPVKFDARVSEQCVYIPSGFAETATLGAGFGDIELGGR